MTRLRLASDVIDRHPSAAVAACAADLGETHPPLPSGEDVRAAIAGAGGALETLSSHPLVAPWRAATAAAGLKPSTYRSSPEALARRFLKGDGVATPLPYVDLYCAISAAHLAPLGGYDLDRLPGEEVDIRLAAPDDSFSPIGGGVFSFAGSPVVYAIGSTVICYCWNHRDSQQTSLIPNTQRALFVGEAVTAIQQEALLAAFAELRERLVRAGATLGELLLLDGSTPVGVVESAS